MVEVALHPFQSDSMAWLRWQTAKLTSVVAACQSQAVTSLRDEGAAFEGFGTDFSQIRGGK